MNPKQPQHINTISEFHKVRGLSAPLHPLVSVVNFEDIKRRTDGVAESWIFGFYSISLKRNVNAKIRYGQQQYDFDGGIMFFISPGQVFGIEPGSNLAALHSGWLLLVHPDFLWNTPLAKSIKQYEFFDYAVNEALFLSDKEENTLNGIIQNIRDEHSSNIDKFTQGIIIAQIETLLNYADRFYQRQFVTRQIGNHDVLTRLEDLLTKYFTTGDLAGKGLPTVKYVSDALNISPNYLSNVLTALTGKSTQQHIHDKVIEIAKERLSTSSLSVSEIAYELGFDYPQSFSKLFKTKTHQSPLEFRKAFN